MKSKLLPLALAQAVLPAVRQTDYRVHDRAQALCDAFTKQGAPLKYFLTADGVLFTEPDGTEVQTCPTYIILGETFERYIAQISRYASVGGIPGAPILIDSSKGKLNNAQWKSSCVQLARVRPEPQRTFWLAMAAVLDRAQTFEFGELPNKRIRELASRAGPLMAAGFMDLPYQAVVYWYSLAPDDGEAPLRMVTLATHMDAETSAKIYDMKERPGSLLMAADFAEMELPEKDKGVAQRLMLVAAGAFRTSATVGAWEGNLLEAVAMEEPSQQKISSALVSVADGTAALSLLLSTKGVEIRTEVPARKLQQKREHAGRHPLPTVTYVMTKRYLDAVRNTEIRGTHSSPVPHLRRGHLRHYTAGEKASGRAFQERTIWIKDMVINCTSLDEAQSRDHYEVKKDECVTRLSGVTVL